MKTILLAAALLGCCNLAAAANVGDTFLKMRIAAYFRNPLAFPEPGIDILSGADMLADEQSPLVLPADVRTQVMRGETWLRAGGDGPPSNGLGLWGLLFSTFASLICGGCLSVAGNYVPRVCGRTRRRRRVKVQIRMLAGY